VKPAAAAPGADSGAAATLSDDTPAASSDCSQSVQVPLLLCRLGHSNIAILCHRLSDWRVAS